jgi:hypothetical protein
MPVVLDELCILARDVHTYKGVIQWKNGTITDYDIKILEEHAQETDQFDRLKLKMCVMNEYKKGVYKIECKESPYARIIAILPNNREIPLEDWSYIFQMFGVVHKTPWNIYWYGSLKAREFPEKMLPITAEHVNGGYTTSCSNYGIFIYRWEEATRVLIHELLHASCMNPKTDSIAVIEATIETWAELILIAHRSKGRINIAIELLKKQIQWVADTNYKSITDHNTRSDEDYGWRYLNGREKIYNALGIRLPAANKHPQHISTRFTTPILGD